MQESQTKNTTKIFRSLFCVCVFFSGNRSNNSYSKLTELEIKRPDLPQSSLLLENCSGKMTETNA
jgi:hypothetical protein